MKKRLLASLLAVFLILSVLPVTASALYGTLGNFKAINTYYEGRFSDVNSSQWFSPYVKTAYEYGLLNGKTPTTYEPDSYLTIAEAIKLAVCINNIYYNGTTYTSTTSPWYRAYVDYALRNGIISDEYPDYNANATRAEFAVILCKALPATELKTMNTVDNNAIPDVHMTESYANDVYLLYRAGILKGSDSAGNFYPYSNIKRSEMSAIASRMANPSLRQTVTLKFIPPEFQSSPSTLSLGLGTTEAVMCKVVYSNSATIAFTVADSSIVSCAWGEWYDSSRIALYIYGMKPGFTTISVQLLDSYGVMIASSTISVTVAKTGVATYAGFYPVVDFGQYYNVQAFFTQTSSTAGHYYYTLKSIAFPLEEYRARYAEALELYSGYTFYKEYYDSDGNLVQSYYNSSLNSYVYIGTSKYNGIDCFKVDVYF